MEKMKQKNNWDLYGNDVQINFLKKNIESDDIAHAYLFTGPDQVGKKKTAISFIKSIICENREKSSFCSSCSNCKKIDSNQFPDATILDGDRPIKISEIRNIISSLSLKAFNSPYKVVIIDNAERMNDESSNAILKTLEEPQGKTIIILITQDKNLMLPTIVSRARIIRFSSAPKREMDSIESKLFKEKSDISYLCAGKIGKLINLSDNEDLKLFFKNASLDINNITKNGVYKNLQFAEELYSEYEKTPELFIERINVWTLIMRKLVLKNYTNSIDLKAEDAKMSISPEKGQSIIDFLFWVKNNLKNTKSGLNYKLIIDKLVLNISQAGNE
jgi:DNA polymerase-3 subunit delta'